jgi:hypothetical protein
MQEPMVGSELAKLRASSLRQDAARGAGPGVMRWRVVLGRRIVRAGARLRGGHRPSVPVAVERRRA